MTAPLTTVLIGLGIILAILSFEAVAVIAGVLALVWQLAVTYSEANSAGPPQ